MMNRFAALMFLWVSFDAVISLVASNPTGTDETENELARISFLLYTGKTIDEYTSVVVGNATNLIDKMNPSKPTVFYIFGYGETPNSESVTTVVSAYLRRQDHNVILINWEEFVAKPYLNVAPSVSRVGSTIAEAINKLVAAGLDPTTLHLLSQSLGSQVAGHIGRKVNFTLSRITGLDPAGVGFNVIMASLSSADAKFVDVIHTDAGFYGTILNRGTANFYPNGGFRLQPGCPIIRLPIISTEDLCDHRRAWRYYAESLLKEDAFIGVQCDFYIAFELGFCNSNARVVMGYGTPTTASGNFYLTTNSESPYGKGQDGV